MRISGLAEATGVPVHTLKYYLREGLLMPGEPTSRTSADYGPQHVERVRLVRALIEQGGIGIAGVHAILDALAAPPARRHDLLGAAHSALPMPGADAPTTPEVLDLLDDLGWRVDPDCPPARALGAALDAARQAGIGVDRARATAYARAMQGVVRIDLDVLDESRDPAEALRTVVLGNVLVDPILIALRRLAQEAASAERDQR